jgi:hypothetical protein
MIGKLTGTLLEKNPTQGDPVEAWDDLKASFDKLLMSNAWDRLETRAILFPNTPTVIAASAFGPFIDMDGRKLQDFEDSEAEMSQVCISVIPTETGGAAIFSWLDSSNSAPSRFFESVINSPDMTAPALHAIFDNTENFAINPSRLPGPGWART